MATGRRPTALNKAVYWDWMVKPNNADVTAKQAPNEQSHRRSSFQPLMEALYGEGYPSHDSRSAQKLEERRMRHTTASSATARDESPSISPSGCRHCNSAYTNTLKIYILAAAVTVTGDFSVPVQPGLTENVAHSGAPLTTYHQSQLECSYQN